MAAKRAKPSKVLEFLRKAQKDSKLNARVLKAVERGGRVTAQEVLEIAREFGFSFTKDEFEREARRDIQARFAAGDQTLASVAARPAAGKAPESSCQKGCLSYTVNYHPELTSR